MQSEMQNTRPVAVLPLLHCQQHVPGCQTSDLRRVYVPGVCVRLLPGVTFCITTITSIYEYGTDILRLDRGSHTMI